MGIGIPHYKAGLYNGAPYTTNIHVLVLVRAQLSNVAENISTLRHGIIT